MKRYFLWRLARVVPLVVLISLITFTLLHLAPGGPVGIFSGSPRMTGKDAARIRENLGLEKPLPLQYLYWFKSTFLRFDFGRSYITGRPVSEMILDRLPATLELMGTAFLIAVFLSFLIGALAAVYRRSIIDQFLSIVSITGMSVPVFWLGLMAILLFSVKLGLLPSGGSEPLDGAASLWQHLKHLILPSSVLALAYLSTWSNYIRAGLIEAFSEDYIRTARAKGLGETRIVFKHAMRGALLPFVAALTMQASTLFTGAVITEAVFSWPGMGLMFYQGIQRGDYTRILGVVVIASLCIILFNIAGDMICFLLDPRSRGGLSEIRPKGNRT